MTDNHAQRSPREEWSLATPLPDERTVEQIAEQDAHEHVAEFCADIEDGQADGYSEAA